MEADNVINELSKYRCHKEVRAARIETVVEAFYSTPPFLVLLSDPSFAGPADDTPMVRQEVTPEWMKKNKPQVGGYFVAYEDGYTSYSPAKAFEEGYVEVGQDVTEFQLARMTMKRAFNADIESGGIYDAYQSNVAMLLHDRFGINGHLERNEAAAAILNLIFDLQDTPPAA